MTAMAIWVKLLAVPMPPPGPCDAKALAAGSSTADAAAMAARDSMGSFPDMAISRDSLIAEATDEDGAGFEIFSAKREPARAIRIHFCGADIHFTVFGLRCGGAAGISWRTTLECHQLPREDTREPEENSGLS